MWSLTAATQSPVMSCLRAHLYHFTRIIRGFYLLYHLFVLVCAKLSPGFNLRPDEQFSFV